MPTSIPESRFSDLRNQLEVLGWAVGNDIVSSDLCLRLKQWALLQQSEGKFSAAQMGRGSERALLPAVRGDSTLWLEESMQPEIFALLEGLRRQLNESFFLGLQSFECHLAHYPPGARYESHIDQARSANGAESERVISFVIYLNEHWQKDDGGELVFCQSGEQVLPTLGRLALFRSDTIEHEVLPSRRDRWSLTGWFRRRTL